MADFVRSTLADLTIESKLLAIQVVNSEGGAQAGERDKLTGGRRRLRPRPKKETLVSRPGGGKRRDRDNLKYIKW